jgi:murein L,D-transpeptidase YcbB/YkuD
MVLILPERGRLTGRLRSSLLVPMAALVLGFTSAPALADVSTVELSAAIKSAGGPKDVRGFYAARSHLPLWIRDGAIGAEADQLLRLIETAELDGLDPRDYRPRAIAEAIEKARDGSPRSLAKAEVLLSRTFAALARDMRRPRDVGMIYAESQLAPRPPSVRDLLREAGAAPAMSAYLKQVGWMSPIYGQLRTAAMAKLNGDSADDSSADELRIVRLNLDRARALPVDSGQRYVIVDAAAARLYMYEKGKVAGTMRVVVGRRSDPTPMMAALIRYASVNPYWNVPPDLVRSRVAPGAIESGAKYLKAKRFEVLSDWTEDARVLPAKEVDWKAILDGRTEPRVRQLPGPGNAMGQIKFMFPNELGVYLHDTPDKGLLRESDRMFSAGCVRLEDAPRLARWLFGKPVTVKSKKPEQRVDLPQPVPVYLTYLTAAPSKNGIAMREDVYGRDAILDRSDGSRRIARR